MATFGKLAWRELQPFGAEVDFSLCEPLNGDEAARLKQLLFEHQVLIFHGQNLTHDQQAAVMEYIEPVLRLPEFMHFISTDIKKGVLGTQRLPFHSDLSFAENLRLSISLHAVDLVDGGSSTIFASGIRVLDRLPTDLRDRLRSLRALHVMPWNARGQLHRDAYNNSHLSLDPPDWVPRCSHPAILSHPRTGRPVLYVNEMLTSRIEGLPEMESRALLDELFGYIYSPDNLFEHVWHKGDLVIWDNVSTQHARGDVSACGPRTLQKVQLGKVTLEQQWPQYSAEAVRKNLSAGADAGL